MSSRMLKGEGASSGGSAKRLGGLLDSLLYFAAKGVVVAFGQLPVRWAARIGRCGGGLAFILDGRHRRVALGNLRKCFGGELGEARIQDLARENFRRIGENYACAISTAFLGPGAMTKHLEYEGLEKIRRPGTEAESRSRVFAIGHFGNFEAYAHLGDVVQVRTAATYRGFRSRWLTRLIVSLRERSGCEFFERRTEGGRLREAVRESVIFLGFLADQHAGKGGAWLPFLGHECSTSTAPAVFALRYNMALHTSVCYRIALGRWRIEIGDEIPTKVNGEARPVEEITLDVNRALESAVRKDPANWFWVHNRWKGKSKAKIAEPENES